MAASKLTYSDKTDKIPIKEADKQVGASDLNEIKSVVNANADESDAVSLKINYGYGSVGMDDDNFVPSTDTYEDIFTAVYDTISTNTTLIVSVDDTTPNTKSIINNDLSTSGNGILFFVKSNEQITVNYRNLPSNIYYVGIGSEDPPGSGVVFEYFETIDAGKLGGLERTGFAEKTGADFTGHISLIDTVLKIYDTLSANQHDYQIGVSNGSFTIQVDRGGDETPEAPVPLLLNSVLNFGQLFGYTIVTENNYSTYITKDFIDALGVDAATLEGLTASEVVSTYATKALIDALGIDAGTLGGLARAGFFEKTGGTITGNVRLSNSKLELFDVAESNQFITEIVDAFEYRVGFDFGSNGTIDVEAINIDADTGSAKMLGSEVLRGDNYSNYVSKVYIDSLGVDADTLDTYHADDIVKVIEGPTSIAINGTDYYLPEIYNKYEAKVNKKTGDVSVYFEVRAEGVADALPITSIRIGCLPYAANSDYKYVGEIFESTALDDGNVHGRFVAIVDPATTFVDLEIQRTPAETLSLAGQSVETSGAGIARVFKGYITYKSDTIT